VMELMLTFGWTVPALIIVLFSTFTTTFLDIYSTAISGLNIVPTLGEKRGVILGGILGTATALVFPTILEYEHFLLFIGAMFCPLFGVVLTDYFLLRKGSLHTEDLYREGGRYWFTHGVNPVALLAWVVGFMIYMGFSAMLMQKVLGIKAALPWPIGSSLPSMIVAGAIYWAFERYERGRRSER
jgi:NCS1 family nucleobase:cation symporter-1